MTLNLEAAWVGLRCDTICRILLIQSGHTFLQIILIIIPQCCITALNQTELWVRSRGGSDWRTPPGCVTGTENIISLPVCLSFILFVSNITWSCVSPRQSDFTSKTFPLSLSLVLIFCSCKTSPAFLIYFDWSCWIVAQTLTIYFFSLENVCLLTLLCSLTQN